MIPRDPGCLHPLRTLIRRDGDVDVERCQLCDVVLHSNRVIGRTTTEVTGR